MKRDDTELYTDIFERLSKLQVEPEQVLTYLEEYKKREVATKVYSRALDVIEGRGQFDDILQASKEYELKVQEEEQFVTDDLSAIQQAIDGAGFHWRLKTLNKMLGPIRQGHCGMVFGRPEVGKTTWLTSEISFIAEQAKDPILWINNEQEGQEVMSRIYQASLGCTREQLYSDLVGNKKLFYQRTAGRIKLLDDAGASRKQVERVCKQLRPCLIVFDQLDKIRGFDADRYDLQMKAVYQWSRELAKEYGPTIGMCQAGGTAEDKKWLTMNDVDSSHTAKQGEVDWILGIGAIAKEGFEHERYLHLCKNKLPGDKDTLPALRHGKCPVRIRPEIARYEDQLKW